jgi:PKD repeat protein
MSGVGRGGSLPMARTRKGGKAGVRIAACLAVAVFVLNAMPQAAPAITAKPISSATSATDLAFAMARGETTSTLVYSAYWVDYGPVVVPTPAGTCSAGVVPRVTDAPAGVSDAPLTAAFGVPNGQKFAIMTSGSSQQVAAVGACNDFANGNAARGTLDTAILAVVLDVPPLHNCLAIDFQFLSEEYPAFVGGYNDAFIAELDRDTWTSANAIIFAPDNFAQTPSGAVVSVNSVPFAAANGAGTAYDMTTGTYGGASGHWVAKTPVAPLPGGDNHHVLYLSIFDAGDNILDSAVFLDNLRTYYVTDPANLCKPGISPSPVGPKADWTWSDGVCASNTVLFDASSSTAGGAPIAGYEWDFGDGQTGTGQTTSHTYTPPPTSFTVTLTVTDANGNQDTSQKPVTLPEACTGPTASFTWLGDAPCGGTTITFDGRASTPGSTPIIAYLWDFGDGTTAGPSATLDTTSHAYAVPPWTYTVTLTVTDQKGLSSTTSQGITIPKPCPPPPLKMTFAAGMNPSDLKACGAHEALFQSSVTGGVPPYEYAWEFGDGAQSNAANPTHGYARHGFYPVTLTVSDAVGQISQKRLTLEATGFVECDSSGQPMGTGPAGSRPQDATDATQAQGDLDGDGIQNGDDNCVSVSNPDQADRDGDGLGDACDDDLDGDGVADLADNCPDVRNPNQADFNGDGFGDACDGDIDGDGVPNASDNCARTKNADQADLDDDGVGDACQQVASLDTGLLGGVSKSAPVQTPAALKPGATVPASGLEWLGIAGAVGVLVLVAIVAMLAVARRNRANQVAGAPPIRRGLPQGFRAGPQAPPRGSLDRLRP